MRPGRIFRSARLDRYEPRVLRSFLQEMRIRTIVDLRNEQDLREHRYGPLVLEGIRYVNLQLHANYQEPPCGTSPVERLRDIYSTVLNDPSFPGWAKGFLEEISNRGNLPLVFHCDEGAHRTGILAAVLLDLVGASEGEIVEDYLLTAGQVRREYIEALLDRLRSWGGARAYLLSKGVPRSLIDQVVDAVTAGEGV